MICNLQREPRWQITNLLHLLLFLEWPNEQYPNINSYLWNRFDYCQYPLRFCQLLQIIIIQAPQ